MQYFTKWCTVGLVLMLGFTSWVKGQGYESIFGDSSTSWKQIVYVMGNELLDSFFIKDNKLIDGVQYKEIRHCEDCDAQGTFFHSFIREDTTKGKIWLRRDGQEALVMDMSLTQSDSFFVDSLYAPAPFRYGWKQVDTVYHQKNKKHILLDGEFHRKHQLEFIEGVGPSLGFNSLFPPSPKRYWLTCAYKDSTLAYFNQRDPSNSLVDTIFQSCPGLNALLGGLNNTKEKNLISVYPNPAQKVITLEIKNINIDIKYLKLYNATGQLMKSKKFNSDKVLIRKPGQGNIYFYLLQNEKGEPLKRGKILFTE